MKTTRTNLVALALLIALMTLAQIATAQIASHVVISEVYAGGGNSGATYTHDFVELYNPTASPIIMTSWSLQYQSAGGLGTFTNIGIFSGTIPAYGFFLIQCGVGAGGTTPLPTPDADLSATHFLGATAGKVALASDGTGVNLPTDANVVDFVGYGATANRYEGSGPTPAPSNTTSVERKAKPNSTADSLIAGGGDELEGNGQDANVNASDFVVRPPLPGPQNTASPTEVPPTLSNVPPIIGLITRSFFVAEVSGVDTIKASVTDGDGTISSVRLHVRVNGGSVDSSLTMTLGVAPQYIAVIPATKHTTAGHLVEYWVTSIDNSSGWSSTESAPNGYFVGDAPISLIKSNPLVLNSLVSIATYGARINGTINVRTNTFSNGQGFIQDATGGLQMFLTGGLIALPAGKNVKVQGTIINFNGAYELSAPNLAFVDTSLGTSVLTPVVITLPTTQTPDYANEGKLVKIVGMSTASTGNFASPASYLYNEVDTDTITMRVESNAGLNTLVGQPIPVGPTDVIGILSYSNGFQRIKPRIAEDMGLVSANLFAVQSGPWSSAATWGGTIPDSTKDVYFSNTGVTVNIDVSNARCKSLTMVGSGSVSNSGPVLEFDASGARGLTVENDISISGGSGGGGGDRGGRPKLTSNGNASAILTVKGQLFSSSSNSPSNGDAGLNMNEGTIKMVGANPDTILMGAGMRVGHLQIGDGSTPKSVATRPQTNAFLNATAITVKAGSTFWIGTGSNTSLVTLGNSTGSGFPMLNGGITVESGAALKVQESSAGFVANTINLDGGGITNNGTIDLVSPAGPEATGCVYHIKIGGHSQGTSGQNQNVSGSGVGSFANVTVDSGHTLTLNQDMGVQAGYKLTILNGTLSESTGNTVIGAAEASRNLAMGVPESFSGLGLTLTATTATPGVTVVTRVTGTPQVTGTGSSIERYFNIAPTTNTGLGATFRFYYDESELGGQDENTLAFYKSTNSGGSWTSEGGASTPASNYTELTGIASFSRWTVADASNPLSSFAVNVPIAAGWNMLSNPVTAASDSVLALFPTSSFNYGFAFIPASGYQQDYTFDNGTGYWAKFAAGTSQSISGSSITSDTIPVATGWNMIGSISSAVDTGDVVTSPSGIRASVYFGYSSGYVTATTIDPGQAYWVKSNAAGSFILTGGAAPAGKPRARANILEGFCTVTLTDASGASQTLYFGSDREGTFPVNMFEMPPQAPAGAFDARFESNRMVVVSQDGKAAQHGITIQSSAYPIRVSWNVTGSKLTLSDGVNPTKSINGSGSMMIQNSSVKRLVLGVQSTEVPVEFSLNRNYPNPFNPATTIQFGLPITAQVTLRVYNLLGQQVSELVNGVLEAGYHDARWEGRNASGDVLSSGVYFYKIEASPVGNGKPFSAVHKMMLMK